MNNLLRPRIWPSFLASSVVGPCDVPFGYASEPIPRYRGTVARWDVHLRGLATAIHKISGLANESGVFLAGLNEVDLVSGGQGDLIYFHFFFGDRQIDHEGSTNLGFTGA
jgi:hypothetical protein